jgi:glycosyltransferase involved in cell wall biosynthesis
MDGVAAPRDEAAPRRVGRIAVILSGWPRVSETFALNELLALRSAGLLGAIFATKPGDPRARQPGVDDLGPLVEVLPAGDPAEQGAAVAERVGGFGLAGVHGYFAHGPAAVASEAADRLGLPFGFSAHARDVRKVGPADLAARCARARLVLACNRDVAASLVALRARPRVVRHGVDVRRFADSPGRRGADGATRPGEVLRVLAVGRMVEKKGFDVLLDAVARTRRPVHLRLVGDGPLRPGLAAAAARLPGRHRAELLGLCTHDDLPQRYRWADVVAVPSIVDRAGDRDGLPNVVLEAMASGRPVLASDVAAIASAVLPGRTGWLVPPGDATALAAALDAVGAGAPDRLGGAARREATVRYDLKRCTETLCRVLERAYPPVRSGGQR